MNITETLNGILEALSRCKNLLIVIKGSPDPDVIASSYALKLLATHRGVHAQIVALARISLPQNSAIVNELGISMSFDEQGPSPEGHDAYAVLDHQSAYVERLSGRIPCAIHIDHHEKTEDTVNSGYSLISTTAGSVSTIMALVLKNAGLGLSPSERRNVATALYLGMLTDTDNFRHAGPHEQEAVEFLSPMMDKKIISRITSVPLSDQTQQLIGRALTGKVLYRDWLFAGLGYIDESIRDSIAITADFLLEREDAQTVIIYAMIDRRHGLTLDASFRTRNPNLDLDTLIKKITPNGGGRMYKGAFQINLDYFRNYDDRDALWSLLDGATRQVLRASRDGMHFTELKGFYRRMKRTLRTLFTGEESD